MFVFVRVNSCLLLFVGYYFLGYFNVVVGVFWGDILICLWGVLFLFGVFFWGGLHFVFVLLLLLLLLLLLFCWVLK